MMLKSLTLAVATVAGLGVLGGVTSAAAATVIVDECTAGNKAVATFTATTSMLLCGSGNINGSSSNDAFLDSTEGDDFIAIFKSDGGLSGTLPDLNESITTNSDNHIVFSFTPVAAFTMYVLGVKQGNGFAIVDLAGLSSVEVGTANNLGGRYGSDFSHLNVYAKASTIPPVPLPAAAWMLLAALGGLGLLRRRTA